MTQIIINDNPYHINTDSTLCIGDARVMMGREVLGLLSELVERYQNMKAKYYILLSTRPDPMDPKAIRTKVVLYSHRPPEMLGTMCFLMDNEKGKIDRLWVLPLDRPSRNIVIPSGEFVPEIERAARRMPIIH